MRQKEPGQSKMVAVAVDLRVYLCVCPLERGPQTAELSVWWCGQDGAIMCYITALCLKHSEGRDTLHILRPS